MPDSTRISVERLGYANDVLPNAEEFKAGEELAECISGYRYLSVEFVKHCLLAKKLPEFQEKLNAIATQFETSGGTFRELVPQKLRRLADDIRSLENEPNPGWRFETEYMAMRQAVEKIRHDVLYGPLFAHLAVARVEVLQRCEKFLETLHKGLELFASEVEGLSERFESEPWRDAAAEAAYVKSGIKCALTIGELAIPLEVFFALTPHTSLPISEQELKFMLKAAENAPLKLSCNEPFENCWLYKNVVYKASPSATEEQARLLILADADAESERWDSLRRRYGSDAETREGSRSAIPENVRHEVWRRDGGKCVKCGSRERL